MYQVHSLDLWVIKTLVEGRDRKVLYMVHIVAVFILTFYLVLKQYCFLPIKMKPKNLQTGTLWKKKQTNNQPNNMKSPLLEPPITCLKLHWFFFFFFVLHSEEKFIGMPCSDKSMLPNPKWILGHPKNFHSLLIQRSTTLFVHKSTKFGNFTAINLH